MLLADGGAQALQHRDEARPDIVLIDVLMRGMDGYEVCQRLHQWDPLRRTPIIMLTARTAEADQLRGLDVGADDYITKPFSVKQLRARMQTVLRRSGGRRRNT